MKISSFRNQSMTVFDCQISIDRNDHHKIDIEIERLYNYYYYCFSIKFRFYAMSQLAFLHEVACPWNLYLCS